MRGIVYLSVYKGGDYVDAQPTSSASTRRAMIRGDELAGDGVAAAYFMQNDFAQKSLCSAPAIFRVPLGARASRWSTTRDIAEAAAIELLRRERAPGPCRPRPTTLVARTP